MKLPRVILAADRSLATEALHRLISPYFDVVATVSNREALLSAAVSLKPDLVVVDVGMPLLNGFKAYRQLKVKMPSVRIVFVTTNDDPELAAEAMKIGALGYILTQSAASELVHAMQAALRGKSYITPQIARDMQESFLRNPHGGSRLRLLTARQRDVVQVLAEGKTMREAASILGVVPRTVAFHKYRVMRALGLHTSADLIRFAIRNHIVAG